MCSSHSRTYMELNEPGGTQPLQARSRNQLMSSHRRARSRGRKHTTARSQGPPPKGQRTCMRVTRLAMRMEPYGRYLRLLNERAMFHSHLQKWAAG